MISVMGFRDLQNYTTLKQTGAIRVNTLCFRDLQNYTTLKHMCNSHVIITCFRDLQNYTTLKLISGCEVNISVLEIYRITLLSNGLATIKRNC